MKAALLTEPFHFEFVERPKPLPGPGELLARVRRVGICGSDVHIYRGEYVREGLPLVPGHEFAAEVVEVNGLSSDLAAGDLVTADINIGCGECRYCLSDSPMLCAQVRQLGIHRDGAFAEYIVFPLRSAVKLPVDMTPAVGALLEPLGCVVRSLRRSGLQPGQSLFVIGAGPMGMLHVQVAKTMGANPIVVLEADPRRAELARTLGADVVISSPEDARQAAAQTCGGDGFDVVVECVGKAQLYEFAIGVLRPGGTLSCFGLDRPDSLVRLASPHLVLQEKSLVGTVGASARDMQAAAGLVDSGGIDIAPYTSKVFALPDLEQAFDCFANRMEALKVQITF